MKHKAKDCIRNCMRKDIPQIGMTYQILNKDGIYDLRAIAKEFYEQKTHLDKLGQWTHDRYLKQSSHARGKVRTESSPYFKDCSVWSINHYLGLNRHPYVIKKAQEAKCHVPNALHLVFAIKNMESWS